MTSKEEYLKRYMSTVTAPSKKKQPISNKSRVKILDDDIDVKALIPRNVNNTLDEDIGDDKPAVAQFLDERPADVKELERFRQSKQWKVIAQDDELSSNQLPAAKSKNDSTSKVAVRRRHDSVSDLSPQREPERLQTSAGKRVRHDTDSDQSPARETDWSSRPLAVPKRTRHDTDSDHSPPRLEVPKAGDKKLVRHDSDSDLSPPRSVGRKTSRPVRHDSDSDLSPVRSESKRPSLKNNRHDSDSNVSPPRKSSKARHKVDADLSPVRRKDGGSPSRGRSHRNSEPLPSSDRSRGNKHDGKSVSSQRQTSPGKSRRDTQLSPNRKNSRQAVASSRHDSDSDLSPVRKQSDSSRQQSKQPRHNSTDADLSPDRRPTKRSLETDDRDLSPVRKDAKASKTLSGAKAGLQTASEMRKEAAELKKKELDAFAKISDDLSGRNAKAILRDKSTGRKRNLEEEEAKKKEEDAIKAIAAAKYDEWNKGVKQKELREQQISEALHEVDKPLARYSDDADLDARLREQEREGDTMLAYIRKKKNKTEGKVQRPIYRGPEPPPNRFGIRPGYRWDGVDRSNGFEKLMFSKQSEKKAVKDMAYKWSVEDM